MKAVYEKWDPNSRNTVFKHYFYNKVEEARVPLYQPGPNENVSDWEQAVREKPGKEYIPALATGFTAVAERLKTQRQILAHFNSVLHAINGSLDAILAKHDLETSVRALNAKRKHALIRQRCLAIASKVQVLRNRGYALDTDEDELKSKLEALDRGLADPSLSARTEELWSRLIMLRRHADNLREEVNQRGGEPGDGISEEAEAKAKKVSGTAPLPPIRPGLVPLANMIPASSSRTTTSNYRRSRLWWRRPRRTTRSGSASRAPTGNDGAAGASAQLWMLLEHNDTTQRRPARGCTARARPQGVPTPQPCILPEPGLAEGGDRTGTCWSWELGSLLPPVQGPGFCTCPLDQAPRPCLGTDRQDVHGVARQFPTYTRYLMTETVGKETWLRV